MKATADGVVKTVNDVKNKAIELANKVKDLPGIVWNKIYGIIPTSFELKTTSVAALVWGSTDKGKTKMQCGSKLCDEITAPEDCDSHRRQGR